MREQAGMGVGDYERVSWAYDGFRVQTLSGKETPGYGVRWATGDVIGLAADLDAGTITFYHNGQSLGVAYSDLRLTGDEDALYACLSISAGQSCRVTFRKDKMKYRLDPPFPHLWIN
jgi:Kip1 ubiquitination-promoting complex protein 1